MTFAVPVPLIGQSGEPCVPLDPKTLFGRVLQHVARQWPEHRVIGCPYVVTSLQWNVAHVVERMARTEMLTKLRIELATLALQDGLSVIGFGPVLLLPENNLIPKDRALLSRLVKVDAATDIPFTEAAPLRMLFQQAHVIAPLTSEDDTRGRGLTSR